MVTGPWARPAPDEIGYCKQDCYGAPTQYAWGGSKKTAPHVHHTCWNCAAEVISGGRSSYSCGWCGCEECAYAPVAASVEFDPDIAAKLSSPA